MNPEPELTDEERERYKQLIEETPEKDLLLEIMMEVKTCRYYLERLSGVEDDTDDERAFYECRTCGAEVPEESRQSHLTDAHGAPTTMPVDAEYERI